MTYREEFEKKIVPHLKKELSLAHTLAVPRVQKITVNVGLNASKKEAKLMDVAKETLRRITGQQPVETKARLSIAGFKVREGMVVGLKVTLRGDKMYDFLQKLIHITLPRSRDFRGILESSVDATGNLTIGFKEHLAFPEIRSDEVELMHGLEVVINTTATTHKEGLLLFSALGVPFTQHK